MAMPPDKTTAEQGPPARSAPTPGSAPGSVPRSVPGRTAGSGPDPSPAAALPPDDAAPPAERPVQAPAGPAVSNGQPTESRAARRSSQLPKRPDRLIAWLAALACLLVAAGPLSIGLFHPDTLHPLEVDDLARSTQTWQQQAELPSMPGSLEPWVPVLDDQPQLDRPPGGTWLHLLAFAGLEADATADERLMHARLASLVLALLTILAVFWAAMSIGGLLPATLAGLVAGSLPVLMFHGRLASDHLAPAALATLAVAAAIWALRPLRPANHLVRQGLGWMLCGLLLGLATLTGGLPATAAALLPLVLILILCPNRLSHGLGLVAALFIAGLVTTPWALYVHEQDPDVWR
ncbi:MAG: hypothetical protein WD534_08810, partial [Phycisphaeraceae bacterium]